MEIRHCFTVTIFSQLLQSGTYDPQLGLGEGYVRGKDISTVTLQSGTYDSSWGWGRVTLGEEI